jgi:hypothetical protein
MTSSFTNEWTLDRQAREAALARLDALSRLFVRLLRDYFDGRA